jgi:hypothetical protein
MGRRVGRGVIGAVIGYVVGAFGGGLAVSLLSTNRFDRAMEAEMTGAFVLGPLVALLGFVVAFVRAKPAPCRAELMEDPHGW